MTNKKIRNDIILTASILCVSLIIFLLFFSRLKAGKNIEISVNGKVCYTLDINEDTVKTVKTEWGENVIQVKGGSVSVSYADCPDKICVHHRAVSKTGETIVCLPHKLVVEIGGTD